MLLEKAIGSENRLVATTDWKGERLWENREILGEMEHVYVLIVLMVTQLCTFVKSIRTCPGLCGSVD